MADAMDSLPPSTPSSLILYGAALSARLQNNLRECQKDALDALVRWFQDDASKNSTALVVMPAGSGKTGVICSLPYWFGNAISNQQLDIDLRKPILVIAPRLDILKQLECDFIQPSGKTPCFLIKVGAIKDERRELRDVLYRVKVISSVQDVRDLRYCQEDIVLTNAQKWCGQKRGGPAWRDVDNGTFSIVIVDEAHHLPAPQWQNIIDKFQSHAKVIFFTATPYHTDGELITKSIKTPGMAYELKNQI